MQGEWNNKANTYTYSASKLLRLDMKETRTDCKLWVQHDDCRWTTHVLFIYLHLTYTGKHIK